MKFIECPRDAWQGFHPFIPSEIKLDYLNQLIRVGFDTIDFGSFVSPKAIPQMQDTAWIADRLDLSGSNTSLLAIVVNERGAADACAFEQIGYLGYPFSISETFQMRNTQATIAESFDRLKRIAELCAKHKKELVIYISMGFGNPYGDAWSPGIVFEWVNRIAAMGVPVISLADTVGLATPEQVYSMTGYVIDKLPQHQIGVHLHSGQHNRAAKIEAAWKAGCRRFDSAMKGIGGCPMANDDLVGNIDTEWLISYLEQYEEIPTLNKTALAKSVNLANEIFTL